jgi:site-specific DNA-methyltransferase (adenine-specific)
LIIRNNNNELYFGDCFEILKTFYDTNNEEFIDFVYIDPPFNSKRNYNILSEEVKENEKAQKEAFVGRWSSITFKDTLYKNFIEQDMIEYR